MNALFPYTEKYLRCIKASKAVRWDIDNDVIKVSEGADCPGSTRCLIGTAAASRHQGAQDDDAKNFHTHGVPPLPPILASASRLIHREVLRIRDRGVSVTCRQTNVPDNSRSGRFIIIGGSITEKITAQKVERFLEARKLFH